MAQPGEGTLVLERGQRRRGCSGNPSCSGLAEVDHHDNHDDDDGDGDDDDNDSCRSLVFMGRYGGVGLGW